MSMVDNMSNAELKENLSLSSEEVDFKTRDELVICHFMPDTLDLEEFRAGWTIFMNRIPMTSLVPELNAMMCEPDRESITFSGFMQCFEQKNREDELFLRYVRTLNPEQVSVLVTFITGKKRLPLYELGEEKISVAWTGEAERLATAQNCTHTLILPCDARNSDVEKLAQTMQPIFHFDTVYGFS